MSKDNNRKYINSFFGKKSYQDGDSMLFSVGLKKKDFLKEINALPENENGFINLTIGTQKADQNKISLFIDEFDPDKRHQEAVKSSGKKPAATSSKPSGKVTGKPKKVEEQEEETDDLPF